MLSKAVKSRLFVRIPVQFFSIFSRLCVYIKRRGEPRALPGVPRLASLYKIPLAFCLKLFSPSLYYISLPTLYTSYMYLHYTNSVSFASWRFSVQPVSLSFALQCFMYTLSQNRRSTHHCESTPELTSSCFDAPALTVAWLGLRSFQEASTSFLHRVYTSLVYEKTRIVSRYARPGTLHRFNRTR